MSNFSFSQCFLKPYTAGKWKQGLFWERIKVKCHNTFETVFITLKILTWSGLTSPGSTEMTVIPKICCSLSIFLIINTITSCMQPPSTGKETSTIYTTVPCFCTCLWKHCVKRRNSIFFFFRNDLQKQKIILSFQKHLICHTKQFQVLTH